MILLPLAGGTKRFPQTDPSRTVNMYASKVGSEIVLECSPGLSVFATVPGSGGIRGILGYSDYAEHLFAVRGNQFYEWTGAAFVSRGTLEQSSGIVGMVQNQAVTVSPGTGGQVLIVDKINGDAYVYDVGNPASFSKIDGSTGFGGTNAFPGGGSVAGYSSLRGFSIEPNTGKLWASKRDSDTPATAMAFREWDGIATATAETFPDALVNAVNIGSSLILFGKESYEVWMDQGLPDFPWRRVQAGERIGCVAPGSVFVYGGMAYWLGGSPEGKGIVYRTDGGPAQKISDQDTDRIISGLDAINDCTAYIYQEEGQVFYVMNFGEEDRTLVYNITSGLWSEWEYRNQSGSVSRHPGIKVAFFEQKNLVGDLRNGNIYEMSRKYVDNDGLPIIREKIFPVWPQDTHVLTSMPPFFVSMDVGVTPSGEDAPLVMMSYSDNRGKTFSTDRYRNIGVQGQYNRRLVWDGMGSSFGRAYRIRMTGNVSFVIRKAGMLDELMGV